VISVTSHGFVSVIGVLLPSPRRSTGAIFFTRLGDCLGCQTER